MQRRITKAAVIGSAGKGSAIAALCAGAGISTLLLDNVPAGLKEEEKKNPKARNQIVNAALDAMKKAKEPVFMDKDRDAILIRGGNLEDDFDKVRECDIIFEAISDDLKSKRQLYSRLEKGLKKTAIVASTTSGLPLKALSEGLNDEFVRNFVIMNFFVPVRYTRLLNLVRGPATDNDVCTFIGSWAEKSLGKTIVWAYDTPGSVGFEESGSPTFYVMKDRKKEYYDLDSNRYKNAMPLRKTIFLAEVKKDKGKVVKAGESASLIDLGDGVFDFECHSKMNATNRSAIESLQEALEYVTDNGVGLVLGNQASGPRAGFSAGDDLSAIMGLAQEKKYSEIDALIQEAQKAIMGVKYSSFPVVAAPYGPTLGWGCGVCLGADRIVAHVELYMGFIEIIAGLLPACGGMMQLWQGCSSAIQSGAKIVDYSEYFMPVFSTVVQARVSTSAMEARNMGFLKPTDKIIFNRDYLIEEAKKEVLALADNGYTPPVKKKIVVMGQTGLGMVLAQLNDNKVGGFISPHRQLITTKIAYCMSGGEAYQGLAVSEDYLLKLEREAYVELWKTESTLKMADQFMKTGKPLVI